MIVDFRKLQSFVKIVDAGSISRAAGLLNTAQPALSQQIAALEQHFGKQLLIRSNSGVAPTQAGLVLYRHAVFLLKHLEQVQLDVSSAAQGLAGHVSVGLATYSTTSALSLPIIKEVRRQFPGITLHINDSFGQILSELVMSGRMDMAVIYADQPIKGTHLQRLFSEELFLVTGPGFDSGPHGDGPIELRQTEGMPFVLPGRNHFLRKLVDEAFARARVAPVVVAEIESVASLAAAVREGIGAAILPKSVASGTAGLENASIRSLIKPAIHAKVALCTPDPTPMSEPAIAVKSVILKVVAELIAQNKAGLSTV
jgi:LysR family transcriptional regulator, nitrogen assimilation regulatory protein